VRRKISIFTDKNKEPFIAGILEGTRARNRMIIANTKISIIVQLLQIFIVIYSLVV